MIKKGCLPQIPSKNADRDKSTTEGTGLLQNQSLIQIELTRHWLHQPLAFTYWHYCEPASFRQCFALISWVLAIPTMLLCTMLLCTMLMYSSPFWEYFENIFTLFLLVLLRKTKWWNSVLKSSGLNYYFVYLQSLLYGAHKFLHNYQPVTCNVKERNL